MKHVPAPEVVEAADGDRLPRRQGGNKYVKGKISNRVVEAADGDQLPRR